MAAYRPLDEATLARLDEPALIEHSLQARAAGDVAGAELALKVFAFGLERPLRAFVAGRMGSCGEAVVEEVAERALEDAIRSIAKLRGRTVEEGRAFVFKIARLRIADHYRRGRPPIASLDDEEGGADRRGHLAVDAGTDAVDTRVVFDAALAGLRPDHRAAVELFLVSGYSGRETAAEVARRFHGSGNDSMSEQNVNQIVSRFRRELRAELGRSAGA